MKRKRLFSIVIVVIGIHLLGLTSCMLSNSRIEQQESASRCSPPAENFSEENLAGIWVAGNSSHTDTLTISPNGTYKQVVHVEFADGSSPIDYESNWQPWHLEYSEENIPYLHLTGMRFCGMNTDISCETLDGGGYDFCKDKYLPMDGEGLLLVLETSVEHYYYLHYPLGSESSWIYSFQGP